MENIEGITRDELLGITYGMRIGETREIEDNLSLTLENEIISMDDEEKTSTVVLKKEALPLFKKDQLVLAQFGKNWLSMQFFKIKK